MLEKLDDDLATLDRILPTLQTLSKYQIANLRHQRNQLSPISTLPVEILSAMLEEYVFASERNAGPKVAAVGDEAPPDDSDTRLTRISTVSIVSRRWKDVLYGASRIWSQIRTSDPPFFIQKALERSRTYPLDLEGALTVDPKSLSQQEATTALFNHVARWSSANLSGSSAAEFDLFPYPPAPILKTLRLKCNPPISTSFDLFSGRAPLLESLILDGVPIRWASPVLAGLRKLSLCKVDGPNSMQLLGILQACPGLRYLRLRDFRLNPSSFAGVTEILPDVHLPHLDALHIYHCAIEVLQLALAHLRCPSATEVRLVLPELHQDSPSEVREAVKPIAQFALEFLQRISANAEALELCTFDDEFGFSTRGEIGTKMLLLHISFLGGSEGAEAIMQKLSENFVFPPLLVQLWENAPDGLWRGLNQFPTAQQLELETAQNALAFLRDPFLQDGILRWNLPHVKILHIKDDCCAAGEEIFKMIQGRMGHPQLDSPPHAELPSPLHSLIIGENCPMDNLTFMKLKAILPEAEVKWEVKTPSS